MAGIEFIKMTAAGNDFIIIDNRAQFLGKRISPLVRRLCRRRRSIGADGLLLIEESQKCDFRMRIFNPDGGEVDMCGNGSRCVAYFARLKKIAEEKMTIETAGGLLTAEVRDTLVRVKLADPRQCRFGFPLTVAEERYRASFLNTGVPHVVIAVKNLSRFPVDRVGRTIRFHRKFQPEGTNADFVQITGGSSVRIRTYERGVEAETLACGTGAVAAAIAAARERLTKSPVEVRTRGGEVLRVYFKRKGDKFCEVYLEGKVKPVYYGATL